MKASYEVPTYRGVYSVPYLQMVNAIDDGCMLQSEVWSVANSHPEAQAVASRLIMIPGLATLHCISCDWTLPKPRGVTARVFGPASRGWTFLLRHHQTARTRNGLQAKPSTPQVSTVVIELPMSSWLVG